MLYLMLFHRDATDWVDGSRIGYDKTGSPVTAGFQPQWHHIYPRSVLKKNGFGDDEINALANITVLNERTNANKLSGKEPWHYIRQFNITEKALTSHMVPKAFASVVDDSARLKQQWNCDRFMDFLIERAQLLAREANIFLEKLGETKDDPHR